VSDRAISASVLLGVLLTAAMVALASIPQPVLPATASLRGYDAWRDDPGSQGMKRITVEFEQMKSSYCSVIVIDPTGSGQPRVQHLNGTSSNANLRTAQLQLEFGPGSVRANQVFNFVLLSEWGTPTTAFSIQGQQLLMTDKLWVDCGGREFRFEPPIEFHTCMEAPE
jgi:hypothetical protein